MIYYVEALMKQWYGGGHLAVRWQLPDGTIEEPIPASRSVIDPWVAIDADIPVNRLTFELVSGPAGMAVEPTTGLLTWTPTADQAPSTNRVTAKVTDDGSPNLSSTGSFTVVVLATNQAPTVDFTSPTNGAVFAAPASILLEAAVWDADTNLQMVGFFDGTDLLAQFTAGPFSFVWTNASPGSHTLTARARDEAGAVSEAHVTIQVRLPEPFRWTDARFVSAQQLRLALTGEPGRHCVIEASQDLSNWIPVTTNEVNSGGTLDFVDGTAGDFTHRFYRARQP